MGKGIARDGIAGLAGKMPRKVCESSAFTDKDGLRLLSEPGLFGHDSSPSACPDLPGSAPDLVEHCLRFGGNERRSLRNSFGTVHRLDSNPNSNCTIDFLPTGRPALGFAYDFEPYAGTERALLHDLEPVFPGPVCRDFGELAAAWEEAVSSMAADPGGAWRTRFFDYVDDANARRVVERIKGLYAAEADPADKLAEGAA